MIDHGDARELAEAFGKLGASLDKIASPTTVTARIDMGGAGVWAATCACLIMVAVMFASGFWVTWAFGEMQLQVNDLKRATAAEIDKLQRSSETQEAYLQAIYQIAPQLKPKESEQ
jgi:hypothetical protein